MDIASCNERLLAIKERIEANRKRLRTLPTGTIVSTKNGKYTKWYVSNGHGLKYLPKTEIRLARYLTKRKILEYEIKDLENEAIAVHSYLRFLQKRKLKEELIGNKLYADIIPLEYRELFAKIEQWKTEKFIQNQSCYHTITVQNNFKVKTKSEEMISMYLKSREIPFRYEEVINYNQKVLIPQFTIMNPHNGNVFYLEHFENINCDNNIPNFIKKIRKYISMGIVPDINLIISFENEEIGFDIKRFEMKIKQFF